MFGRKIKWEKDKPRMKYNYTGWCRKLLGRFWARRELGYCTLPPSPSISLLFTVEVPLLKSTCTFKAVHQKCCVWQGNCSTMSSVTWTLDLTSSWTLPNSFFVEHLSVSKIFLLPQMNYYLKSALSLFGKNARFCSVVALRVSSPKDAERRN